MELFLSFCSSSLTNLQTYCNLNLIQCQQFC
nr:MAG TPA: hypothetical protein [Caudoviricetes sp.]DAK89495.1 MAG TPA: hypothetical protein [Bacteriophage sp.]DAN75777.1 MAG TPA: hypothetical protein [Caudoviricetes sp.]DAS17305.1 MAG TPA: hypothetical protein [Caudoviricetes sp.]DAU36415.1 MAG TPA: hypothetical protein [Caudoviricetes sp.]